MKTKSKLSYCAALLAALLASAVSSHAAFDAFLVFTPGSGTATGTDGVTTDPSFQSLGAIQLQSFSFGVQNVTSIGSGGADGTGKAQFVRFVLKKTVDQASPALFLAAAAGQYYETVQLFLRKAGATGTVEGPT